MSYLLSICIALVVPSCMLGLRLRRQVHWTACAAALLIVSAIGWTWSSVVTAHEWWAFSGAHVTRWHPLPNLLLEEVVFYPSGGVLCIFLYVAFSRRPARAHRGGYLAFLLIGTMAFGAVALIRSAEGPYYLYSILIVYNLLVCGGLASIVAGRIDARGLAISTQLMAILGYVWDHVAFLGGWWQYHASAGLRLGMVPLDDIDFFLFAPPAAISVYELMHSLREPERVWDRQVEAAASHAGMSPRVSSYAAGLLESATCPAPNLPHNQDQRAEPTAG